MSSLRHPRISYIFGKPVLRRRNDIVLLCNHAVGGVRRRYTYAVVGGLMGGRAKVPLGYRKINISPFRPAIRWLPDVICIGFSERTKADNTSVDGRRKPGRFEPLVV